MQNKALSEQGTGLGRNGFQNKAKLNPSSPWPGQADVDGIQACLSFDKITPGYSLLPPGTLPTGVSWVHCGAHCC